MFPYVPCMQDWPDLYLPPHAGLAGLAHLMELHVVLLASRLAGHAHIAHDLVPCLLQTGAARARDHEGRFQVVPHGRNRGEAVQQLVPFSEDTARQLARGFLMAT